ncbi:MAG: shikimate dehydrogenase [Microcystis aeruginosa]
MTIINGKTKLLGVIGDPIGHTLSPLMHNAAIDALGLNYVYLPLPIAPEHLATAIAGFAAIDLQGFSVTIPHKLAIIPLLSQSTEKARLVGAVNTVWRTKTGWQGTNTDVDGFLAPLKSLDKDWSRVNPVILGNGGAARAVVVACAQLGCDKIHVVGRNQKKLDPFKESWANTSLYDLLEVHSWDELEGLLSTTELLINSTPIGMSPQGEQSPVELELLDLLPPSAIAYDLIYNPRPTKFLRLGQTRGIRIIDGLEMLVNQGAIALEIWLGQPVPVSVMREALLKQF